MIQHFDVALIGGGIYGAAISYFLSKTGVRLALIEEHAIGSAGATGFSRGIIRAYDPDPLLTALGLAGATEFGNWDSAGYPGVSPYHRTGCLYRVAPENHEYAIAHTNRLQGQGYKYRLLNSQETEKRFPFIRTYHNDLVIWEPESGYSDPRLTASNLAAGCIEQGTAVYEHSKTVAIDITDGKWCLKLPYSAIRSEILVVAAGANTRSLLPGLPVVARSIGLLRVTTGKKNLQPALPVIDEIASTYIRPAENNGFYAGTKVYEETIVPPGKASFGMAESEDAYGRAKQLLQDDYCGTPVSGCRGYDAYTANNRPIIGFMPGNEALYVATGFSGRGYKYALALSRHIARQVACRLGHNARLPDSHHNISAIVQELQP